VETSYHFKKQGLTCTDDLKQGAVSEKPKQQSRKTIQFLMSTRVSVTIHNPYDKKARCSLSNSVCPNGQWDNMDEGTEIEKGQSRTFTSSSNNRLFCEWTNEYGAIWQMAMTCPIGSNNSACGISKNSGLQTYLETGTPAQFTYILGKQNDADWNHGSENDGDVIKWGACS
jgi:hypothetical protein